MFTQSRLKELLHYCPDTGVFTWLVSNSNYVKVGSIAGTADCNGYVQIKIDRNLYRAHRLAWLYMHGSWPPCQIDHINRSKSDNRICNLRMASVAENHQNMPMQSNNTSGHVGVYWCKQKWRAYIKVNRKQIHLGNFSDIGEAIATRKAAELQYHTFQNGNA